MDSKKDGTKKKSLSGNSSGSLPSVGQKSDKDKSNAKDHHHTSATKPSSTVVASTTKTKDATTTVTKDATTKPHTETIKGVTSAKSVPTKASLATNKTKSNKTSSSQVTTTTSDSSNSSSGTSSGKAKSKTQGTSKKETAGNSNTTGGGNGTTLTYASQTTKNTPFKSRYVNPLDQAHLIRLPVRRPPPWAQCYPPPPPPWGCPPGPGYPPPPWMCTPPGCYPPPPCAFPFPPPPCAPPCGPPPFPNVCSQFGPSKQIIRVPKGCPPPWNGAGACGPVGGGLPCYNNCNFYTVSPDQPCSSPISYDPSYPPGCSGDVLRNDVPQKQYPFTSSADGCCKGDPRPNDMLKRILQGSACSSGAEFFKDLDWLTKHASSGLEIVNGESRHKNSQENKVLSHTSGSFYTSSSSPT